MDPQQIFTWGKIGKGRLSYAGWKNIEKQRDWTNRNLISLEGEVKKPCTSEKTANWLGRSSTERRGYSGLQVEYEWNTVTTNKANWATLEGMLRIHQRKLLFLCTSYIFCLCLSCSSGRMLENRKESKRGLTRVLHGYRPEAQDLQLEIA